jgi:flagellar biosynthesis protein FlhB
MAGQDDKDQRKLPPTAKRVNDFRKRGEIALSKEMTSVFSMAGGALAAFLYRNEIVATIRERAIFAFSHLDASYIDAFAQTARAFMVASLPIIVGAILGWFLAVIPQLGWPPVFKWPKPSIPGVFNIGHIMTMLSPKAGAGRIAKSLAKLAAVGLVATLAAASELRSFIAVPALDATLLGVRLGAAIGRIALYSCLLLLPLAIIDYILAKRRLMARMRMTHAEVKREYREQEGDPTNKRRRRQRMRELARRRVAQAVKEADVVLVNPTEYAVALRYKTDEDRAPRVLAKGKGEPAERIRELARQAGVPIVAEPPLTRMLYKLVPEGREIPAPLYKAVAEVLAYVYRLRRRSS